MTESSTSHPVVPSPRSAPPVGPDIDKREGRSGFFVDKGFPLLTAVLTVAAAGLGLWGASAASERSDLEDTVASLRRQNDILSEENATLTDEVALVTEDRDDWKARAEDEPANTTDGTEPEDGTTSNPSSSSGSVGVYRESRDVPVPFSWLYGIDLESQASDWGVDRGLGDGRDLSYTYGPTLQGANGVEISIVDHVPTEEECQASTALQTQLTTDQMRQGTQMCVLTTEGRYAYVEIAAYDPDAGTISLKFMVWN